MNAIDMIARCGRGQQGSIDEPAHGCGLRASEANDTRPLAQVEGEGVVDGHRPLDSEIPAWAG